MDTVVVIVEGLVLLAFCLLVARLTTTRDSGYLHERIYAACKIFIGLWLICAVVSLWRGIAEEGYSLIEELPFFVVIFAVPAAIAALIGSRAIKRIPL